MNFKHIEGIEFDRSVLILGDLHGVWRKVNSLVAKHRPTTVLQVGDFGWWPKLHKTTKIKTGVWRRNLLDALAPKLQAPWNQYGLKLRYSKLYFCPGNHEDWVSLDEMATSWDPKAVEVMDNVFFMPRCSTMELPDGRRVLFMGGASSIDKSERTPYYDWFPQEIISLEDVDALPDTKIDIVVSHACPREFRDQMNEGSNDWRLRDSWWIEKFRDPSCDYLSRVLYKYEPKLWFFGHYHLAMSDVYNGCRWFCLNKQSSPGWWTFIPRK
ncbi:MAG: metallophosphoesterase [Eudoraea sp.]|nr:metallophosphoesterase [Eudoraea sp.]